jgi:hypothetical protein
VRRGISTNLYLKVMCETEENAALVAAGLALMWYEGGDSARGAGGIECGEHGADRVVSSQNTQANR